MRVSTTATSPAPKIATVSGGANGSTKYDAPSVSSRTTAGAPPARRAASAATRASRRRAAQRSGARPVGVEHQPRAVAVQRAAPPPPAAPASTARCAAAYASVAGWRAAPPATGSDEQPHGAAAAESHVPRVLVRQRDLEHLGALRSQHAVGRLHGARVQTPADGHRPDDVARLADERLGADEARRRALRRDERGHRQAPLTLAHRVEPGETSGRHASSGSSASSQTRRTSLAPMAFGSSGETGASTSGPSVRPGRRGPESARAGRPGGRRASRRRVRESGRSPSSSASSGTGFVAASTPGISAVPSEGSQTVARSSVALGRARRIASTRNS